AGGTRPLRPDTEALGDRRAAVLLERGRVQYAIADRLALLALEDTPAGFLGVKLQANIRLAPPHAIPFPIAHHAAARQNAPMDRIVVLYEGPPSDREWRSRAPVHGSKPHPIFRHFERLDNVPLVIPAIKERPHGDRPVAVEPSAHEFLAAGSPQPLLIRLHCAGSI